jgi:hypothetical protein
MAAIEFKLMIIYLIHHFEIKMKNNFELIMKVNLTYSPENDKFAKFYKKK